MSGLRALAHESIRPAVRADLDRLVALQVRLNEAGSAADPRYQVRPDIARALREHLGYAWFERFLPFPACLVADDGGEIVGFLSAEVVPEHPILAYPPTARLDALWVELEHRRRGLARSLVDAMRDAMVEAGFQRHTVSTLVRDARAVAFWRSMGFEELTVTLAAG